MIRTLRNIISALLMLFCAGNVYSALYVENVAVDNIHAPAGIGADLSASIEDFRDLVFKRCGARLTLGSLNKGIILKLYEGNEFADLPGPLQTQVFRIKTEAGALTIFAKGELGLRMGLYYLLAEYGGCRWYWPGELGEYIPASNDWKIEQISQLIAPSYYSRFMFGLITKEEQLWAIRNQLESTIPVNHNLSHLFSQVSFEKHPEWLPFDGHRYTHAPSNNTSHLWHPNLLAPGIATYAAQVVQKHFEANPYSWSYSIGINDSYSFDLSLTTLAKITPFQYFRNRPVYSNPIYEFNNQVARYIEKLFPGKYLAAYAYYWCEARPTFKVNSNIIPYLTADRAQYYDPAFADEDRKLIDSWSKAGPEFIGLYEYFESGYYWMPRLSNAQLESIIQGYRYGARAYCGELYPRWAFEGARSWLAANLLFDSSETLSERESEFYEHFFGAAQEPIKAFYQFWKEKWLKQPGKARWLKYLKNPQQLELISHQDIQALFALLKKAELLSESDIVRKRIDVLKYSIETLNSAHLLYHKGKSLLDAKDANSLKTAKEYMSAANDFDQMVLNSTPWYEDDLRISRLNNLKRLINPLPSWGIRQTAEALSGKPDEIPEALKVYLELEAEYPPENHLLNAALIPDDAVRNSRHPLARFTVPRIKSWKLEVEPDATSKVISGPQDDSNSSALIFTGCSRIGFSQTLKADSYSKCMLLWECRGIVSPGNFIRVEIAFLDDSMKNLSRQVYAYPSIVIKERTEYALIADAPDDASWIKILLRISGQQESSSFEFINPRLRIQ